MAQVEIQIGATSVRFETTSVKDVFRAFTAFEVLGESKCGACESTNVYPRHRTAKGYDFYGIQCRDCLAELSLGQTKDDKTLFPKRKDERGNALECHGWVKYQPQQSQAEPF